MVNIVILGPGKIAPRFVKGARFETDAKIIGVVGRTLAKTKVFANE